MLYTKNIDGDLLFQIMRIYIESGIPLIVALENKKSGHAIVAIGHEEVKVSAPKIRGRMYVKIIAISFL